MAMQASAILLVPSQQAPAVSLLGSRPELGLRPQASGLQVEALSHFFCLIALVWPQLRNSSN